MGWDRLPLDRSAEDGMDSRYERLVRKALAAYAMEDARVLPIGGRENLVFQVRTSGERYTLRICDPDRDRKSLMRELLWLVALRRDTDLVVPEPLMAMDGEILRTVAAPGIPGFHPAMLLSWVDGETLGEDATPEDFAQLGRATASLHQHGASFRWPEELAPPQTPYVARQQERAGLLADSLDASGAELIREALARITASLDALGSDGVAAGVIHGDLRRRNVVRGPAGVQMIGFDACHRGPAAFDLAAMWQDLSVREDAAALHAALLEGYACLRPIPAGLERHLSALGVLATIDSLQRVQVSPRLRYADWAPRFLRRGLRVVEQFVAEAS